MTGTLKSGVDAKVRFDTGMFMFNNVYVVWLGIICDRGIYGIELTWCIFVFA